MGYAKWRLGAGDQYQIDVARYRVARVLEAYAKDVEGPVALSCETPVDGWDDIAEFGIEEGAFTARHYQVKRQNTDFGAGEREATFGKLFESAAKILKEADPYGDLVVSPARRRFAIVLPTNQVSVGANLGIDQLVLLLKNCESESAADTIVANGGVHINNGKDKGGQQRRWLTLVKTSVGTAGSCAQLLGQMRVEIWPSAFVKEQTAVLTREQFGAPDHARLLIDDALRSTPPEGRIEAEELLPKLADAQPRQELLRVRLTRTDDGYFVQPCMRHADLDVVAGSIVESVWREHGALGLHVGYPPPNKARGLRLACVRLLLHAPRSPVHVTDGDAWRDRCSADVAGALGFDAGKGALDSPHYEEKAPTSSLPPKAQWPPNELGGALHAAMDEHVWERVSEKGEAALVGAEQVPFEELAASMKELRGFFDRVLRGWWEPEKDASGVARAGPNVALRVAEIVAGLATLRHLGFCVVTADVPGTIAIARLGDLPVRALAIEQSGGIVDGLRTAVALNRHARDLLGHAGVMLIGGSGDDLYDLARMQPLDEVGGGAGIQEWTASAFLIDPRSLITSVKCSDEASRDLIQGWCEKRAWHHRAALAAAHEQWGESDAA